MYIVIHGQYGHVFPPCITHRCELPRLDYISLTPNPTAPLLPFKFPNNEVPLNNQFSGILPGGSTVLVVSLESTLVSARKHVV